MNRSYKRSVHLFLKCISLTFKGSIVLSNESIHKQKRSAISLLERLSGNDVCQWDKEKPCKIAFTRLFKNIRFWLFKPLIDCGLTDVFMHFLSIEFRANIFILMDIMIFHIIIQKIISLVFIIGFPFSLIFISHFQIQIIFINGFSSSISHENSILNTSHFSFQLIFINDFFHPISIHKNAHFSLIFQAFSSIFINSFGIIIEIFLIVITSDFCHPFS